MNLTRHTLHELMWSFPATRVAEAMGISGSGLAKLCRRNDIPVPGRGYWRQVEVGQAVEVIPLPGGDPERRVRFVVTAAVESAIEELIAGRSEASAVEDANNATTAETETVVAPAPTYIAAVPERGEVFPRRRRRRKGSCESVGVEKMSSRSDHDEGNVADLSDVVSLARELDEARRVQRLIDCVTAELDRQDMATRSVSTIWLLYAKSQLEARSPVSRVLLACKEIASGKSTPPAWWPGEQSAQDGSLSPIDQSAC